MCRVLDQPDASQSKPSACIVRCVCRVPVKGRLPFLFALFCFCGSCLHETTSTDTVAAMPNTNVLEIALPHRPRLRRRFWLPLLAPGALASCGRSVAGEGSGVLRAADLRVPQTCASPLPSTNQMAAPLGEFEGGSLAWSSCLEGLVAFLLTGQSSRWLTTGNCGRGESHTHPRVNTVVAAVMLQ